MRQTFTKILLPALLIISSLIFTNPSHASVDDFYFESMHVNYELSRDGENRSVMTVSETLTPVFPNFDQNRGIIRMIPLKYDGHSLDFQLISVKRDGVLANLYENKIEDGHQKLMIRDKSNSSYLHGKHTYEIVYRLRDVTHKPDDAEIDELYWDVNGNSWSQTFH